MDNKTVKKHLNRIYYLKMSIHAKELQIAELRYRSTSISAAPTDGSVKSSCANDAAYVAVVNKMLYVEHVIKVQQYELAVAIEEITKRLESFRKDYAKLALLLELRYVNNLPWPKICALMNYEERNIYNLNNKAIDIFVNYF